MSLFLSAECPRTKHENHWRCRPAYEVQMCWKWQNMSAIACYLTCFNQRWGFPCFFRLDAPRTRIENHWRSRPAYELGSRTIEDVDLDPNFPPLRHVWYLTFFNQRRRFPFLQAGCPRTTLENHWRCRPAYEVPMRWKCPNLSAIAWYLTFFLTNGEDFLGTKLENYWKCRPAYEDQVSWKYFN